MIIEHTLSRAERRAIQFGRPFTVNRFWHQPAHRFVGVDADIYSGWEEENHNNTEGILAYNDRCDLLWDPVCPQFPEPM